MAFSRQLDAQLRVRPVSICRMLETCEAIARGIELPCQCSADSRTARTSGAERAPSYGVGLDARTRQIARFCAQRTTIAADKRLPSAGA
eukprot:scaffold277083_cov28-Tisochrysis_lutea.AAC.5